MAWAARDAAADSLNAARRLRFEAIKAAIAESDLPKSVLHHAQTIKVARILPKGKPPHVR